MAQRYWMYARPAGTHRSPCSDICTEERISPSHPLRRLRRLANQVLDRLNPTFCSSTQKAAGPRFPVATAAGPVATGDLSHSFGADTDGAARLKVLFRWFGDLQPDHPAWHPTAFTNNRERLLNEERMAKLLDLLMAAPGVKPMLSSEHFSEDALGYGLGPPTALRSGSTDSTPIRHNGVIARTLAGALQLARRKPRRTSAGYRTPA